MDVEYRRMLDVLGGKPQGRIGLNDVVLWQCGIGKVNAAIGTAQLVQEHHPDCILSTGLAGGIDNCLGVMDVVVGSEVCYHDVNCGDNCDPGQVQGLPRLFSGDQRLVGIATALQTDVRIVPGLICTGDQFITSRAELDDIKRKYPPGLAVDMESAAIAQVCHLWQVPFLSFRIISDTPGVDAHFEQYLNFWDTMADKSFAVTKEFLGRI
jgi:adenosylhomocysteine nucleosidase